MSAEQPTPDVRDEAAALIGEVGRTAEDARRYRSLSETVADPVFDRVIALGSEIRRADRAGRLDAIGRAVAELRSLRARCEEGIADVRGSESYRAMVEAYDAADAARAAELAATVFAGVTCESPGAPAFWPVPLKHGRGGDHFISPERCAARIREAFTKGVTAAQDPPTFGGDEAVRPVSLLARPDVAESPILLVFDPLVLGRSGRVAEADVVLWYAERLRAPFTVRAASAASDEWWEIRPSAYAEYVAALELLLSELSLPFQVVPERPETT